MKVLLIEDDRALGDLLAETLINQHWVVEQAIDGEVGLDLASANEYDLILLDIGLPKLDGITVCRRLRHQNCQTPILLLTAQDSTEAQITGLDAGADDYVTKPFNLDLLLARVRAAARKGKSASPVITWENIELNPTHREVICSGNPVHLTAKEYGLLELFLLNPRRIYSRRAILDHLWDFASLPGEETVSTHIKCVRQKLKAAGASDPIETVHGLGYRLQVAAPSRSKGVVKLVAGLVESQGLVEPQGLVELQEQPAAQRPIAAQPATRGELPDPCTTIPADRPTRQQKAQAVTSKVWQQFKAQYQEQIDTLESLIKTLKPGVASDQQQEIQQLAHKLVGSMGMFGLSEASQTARKLEQVMRSPSLEAAQIAEAVQWVKFVKQAVSQAQVDLPPKLQPLSAQVPLPGLSTKILIVDDDLLLAERLRIEAIAWNLQVEIATDLTVARQMIAQSPPAMILLDLSFPGEETGLTLMRELEPRSAQIPVVVCTAREDLRDRVAAARLGVTAFLQKPLPAHAILKTVTDVLNQKSDAALQNRVLIVDDDPGFLAALADRLTLHGLQVTTSADPQQFWQVLAACHPNILILDLEMPEFDGRELCQVVRADPQWRHLKILFLSAQTKPEAIAKAYAAGADEYISKTIPASDLVTRILHRIGHC